MSERHVTTMPDERCPRCGCSLLTNQEFVWCSFIGGREEKACAFGIDARVPVSSLCSAILAERSKRNLAIAEPSPIDMLLFCPRCAYQHVDAPEPETGWLNPVHKSHRCKACGYVWRPANVPTNGVATIQTKGEKDQDPQPHNVPPTDPAELRPIFQRILCGLQWLNTHHRDEHHQGEEMPDDERVKDAAKACGELLLKIARLAPIGGTE